MSPSFFMFLFLPYSSVSVSPLVQFLYFFTYIFCKFHYDFYPPENTLFQFYMFSFFQYSFLFSYATFQSLSLAFERLFLLVFLCNIHIYVLIFLYSWCLHLILCICVLCNLLIFYWLWLGAPSLLAFYLGAINSSYFVLRKLLLHFLPRCDTIILIQTPACQMLTEIFSPTREREKTGDGENCVMR